MSFPFHTVHIDYNCSMSAFLVLLKKHSMFSAMIGCKLTLADQCWFMTYRKLQLKRLSLMSPNKT